MQALEEYRRNAGSAAADAKEVLGYTFRLILLADRFQADLLASQLRIELLVTVLRESGVCCSKDSSASDFEVLDVTSFRLGNPVPRIVRLRGSRHARMLVWPARTQPNPDTGIAEEQDARPTVPISANGERRRIFISYSHRDSKWLGEFETHLTPWARAGLVDAWSDNLISPGEQWKSEVLHALASARVAVLIVSPNFMASDVIQQYELPPILEAAQNGRISLFWVSVSASAYDNSGL
jgi:hypothetical protein